MNGPPRCGARPRLHRLPRSDVSARDLSWRLRRKVFLWFGAAILLSGLVSGLAGWLTGGRAWRAQQERAAEFLAVRFAEVWEDPVARRRLAEEAAEALRATVVLTEPSGTELVRVGEPCRRGERSIAVTRAGVELGRLSGCWQRPSNLAGGALALGLVLLVLWGLSGRVARRLGRPLEELARVAQELGEGRLDARAHVPPHRAGEVGVVAQAVNEMAARVQRQLEAQREVLAQVSHELRTPLARLAVLTELLREARDPAPHLASIDREVRELDDLVGELSASARLDHAGLDLTTLDAREVARGALERAGLPAGVLVVEGPPARVLADATLLARALANLLRNAAEHGGGAARLVVSATETTVAWSVEDGGPGIAPEMLGRVFEPFVRGASEEGDPVPAANLGLGLALVERIARAHGGAAFAENLEAGARVGFSVPRAEEPAP